MIRYKSVGLNTFTIFKEIFNQINLSKIEKAEMAIEVISYLLVNLRIMETGWNKLTVIFIRDIIFIR
jgi:hypothetical protein